MRRRLFINIQLADVLIFSRTLYPHFIIAGTMFHFIIDTIFKYSVNDFLHGYYYLICIYKCIWSHISTYTLNIICAMWCVVCKRKVIFFFSKKWRIMFTLTDYSLTKFAASNSWLYKYYCSRQWAHFLGEKYFTIYYYLHVMTCIFI